MSKYIELDDVEIKELRVRINIEDVFGNVEPSVLVKALKDALTTSDWEDMLEELDEDMLGDAFERLSPDKIGDILEGLTDEAKQSLVNSLDEDSQLDLLKALPTSELLDLIDFNERADVVLQSMDLSECVPQLKTAVEEANVGEALARHFLDSIGWEERIDFLKRFYATDCGEVVRAELDECNGDERDALLRNIMPTYLHATVTRRPFIAVEGDGVAAVKRVTVNGDYVGMLLPGDGVQLHGVPMSSNVRLFAGSDDDTGWITCPTTDVALRVAFALIEAREGRGGTIVAPQQFRRVEGNLGAFLPPKTTPQAPVLPQAGREDDGAPVEAPNVALAGQDGTLRDLPLEVGDDT